MAGVKKLRKLQLGRESSAGTPVAASTIWRGMGMLDDQREVIFVDEDIGYLSGVDRTYTPRFQGALSMDATEATFEQLPHILEAGVRTDTPAQDGTGSGYIYEYVFPTTAANTLKYYTIEGGDNQAVEEMEYSFVTGFTLSGEVGQAWMMSADWQGRQITEGVSFTTGLTLPAVDEILFQQSKLYIDSTTGTIGSTQKTSTFMSATVTVDTGNRAVWTGDGNKYFTFTKNIGPEVTVDVTFEHDGTATAEKTNWRAETARQIRILSEGATLTTAGAAYTKKTLKVDVAGKWESFDIIGERDGNDIVTGRFRGRYNSTAALFCEINVINELSSLP